jgi:hypothetical protein
MQNLGLFYSLSKHNRYLAAVLQGIPRAVIVVYGYAVDHMLASAQTSECGIFIENMLHAVNLPMVRAL